MSKNFWNKIIFAKLSIIIIILFIFPVSAGDDLELWGYVNPEGNLAPGDEVFCYYTVDYNFESDKESLIFYTDLTDPRWQLTIAIDGAEQDKAKSMGRYERVSGFELYYPGSYQTYVRVKLNGTVPNVGATGNYTIFDVTHYDAVGQEASYSSVERVFINPSDLLSVQSSMEIKISNLRSKIDSLYSQGVDTSLAEVKYSAAYDAVYSAKKSVPSKQSSLLSDADLYITEAESYLDVSWAESSINGAKDKISSVDSTVSYFENSAGLSGDSRVWVIKSYNDNAKTLLVLAEDKFQNKDYSSTRDYALQAENKAVEAYNYAVNLNNELNLNAPLNSEIQKTNAPVSTDKTSSPTQNTQSPANLLDDIIKDNNTESKNYDDIDALLHSEVNIESFLAIAGKFYDLLINAFNFIKDLSALASDN